MKAKLIMIIKSKVIWLLLFFVGYTWFIGWFVNSYTLQFPIVVNVKFQSVIERKIISPLPKKQVFYNPPKTIVPVVQAAVTSEKPAPVFDVLTIVGKIWQLETSKGQAKSGWHMECRAKGLWNEYGYGVGSICFSDKAEADITLTNWFNRELKNRTLVDALCYYNLGCQADKDGKCLKDKEGKDIPYQNCTYYQKYLLTD